MSLPTFSLTSATTQAAAPFTLGHAFKQGDVPAGQSVTATGTASFQCLAKNAWPDGSLKFAVLSGTASLTANTPLTVTLSTGAAAGGTALTTADLKATGVTAGVDCGAFGSVSWATTDWDSPAQTWASGPSMSSWVYRKAVGSDAHLVAWLEVRLYVGGAVEVLPWIENGYVNVASPSNKSDTYAFTLGGSQRVSVAIDLKHHQRTPLINGTALSYWLGADPGVTPLHDRTYLKSTELVPSYSASVAAGAGVVTGQAGSYAPLQAGGFVYDSDSMASTGYQKPIGLLPEHDVVYLTANASVQPQLYASVQRNGFSAGRYGTHYRDESTNRPLRFSQWPHMVIRDSQGFKDNGSSSTGQVTPLASGGNPPTWDVAHSPSVGFLAYLLTARLYFMEEVQFAITCDYLGNGDNAILRNGAQGLVHPCVDAWQTRSCAWNWRHLAQALCVTPDADTALRGEFKSSAQSNIDEFYSRYVVQANNPFGFIQSGTSAYGGGTAILAPWQQDFVTASFGYSLAMDLPLDSGYAGKLGAVFQWMSKSITGRLSAYADSKWPYVNADVYVLSVSSAFLPDYTGGTGPWRADWAEVYSVAAATLATASAPSSWFGTADGTLCGEIMPGERSLWGNLMAALAYAVRFSSTGALAGYNRITSASNYATLATAFNTNPVWSVAPALIPSGGTAVGDTLRIDTTELISGALVIGDTGLGVLGSTIRSTTATGDAGAGVLYNDWDNSGDDNSEFRLQIVSPPSSGTLFVNENGSFSHVGAADGNRSWTYQLYVDGVASGSPVTVSDVFGATTVTGSSSITLGAITGSAAGVVPVRGASAVTLGAITGSFSGAVLNRGTSDVTLGAITGSMTGSGSVNGASSITLGAILSAATGTVRVSGGGSVTLGTITGVFAGTNSSPITGSSNIVLGDITGIFTGELTPFLPSRFRTFLATPSGGLKPKV